MFDRDVFVRPIAHRGLHDAAAGRIENTAPAFEAALDRGYGIECDLRQASDGTPFVFHDDTLDRLVEGKGPIAALSPGQLAGLAYKGCASRILSYAALLELVGGKVPLLVEVKSEWDPPDLAFLKRIAEASLHYRGPVALMSFDPAVMTALRELAPTIPRGIVSGMYDGPHWWADRLDVDRRLALSHLLLSGPVQPSFYAYHVNDLPTPVTRFAREVIGVPLFTWTVRTEAQRHKAAAFADAMIFEGFEP